MLAFAAGCGTPATEGCLEQYSVANGYGFDSDTTTTTRPAPTVDEAVAACEADAGSVGCDVEVTQDAALCLADEAGLGTFDRRTWLGYHERHRRVVWTVRDTDPSDASEGSGFTFDAADGALLERWTWQSTP